MSKFLLPFCFLIVLMFESCSERACTKIGCQDGLMINFEVESETEVRLIIHGDLLMDSLHCGGSFDPCPQLSIHDQFEVKHVDVELLENSMVISAYHQSINYKLVNPNGPNCSPDCFQASITVMD
jgi:hypothetical protein